MKRVAVLVSGGGTNLQALIDAKARGDLPHALLALVVASKPGIFAIERAGRASIPCEILSKKRFDDFPAFDRALADLLRRHNIDVVVLAGYLTILGPAVLAAYPDRILNVHPSLIPSFCGDGFYGLGVHEAALARGVKVTGATVHLVNEITDGGKILLQKAIGVEPDDTPETLQRRVMEQCEWQLLPQAIEMICAALEQDIPANQ